MTLYFWTNIEVYVIVFSVLCAECNRLVCQVSDGVYRLAGRLKHNYNASSVRREQEYCAQEQRESGQPRRA